MSESRKKFITGIVTAFFQITLVTYLHQYDMLVTSLLALSVIFLFWRLTWSKINVITFLVFVVAGFTAEAIAVTQGAWSYAEQHWLGLPLWLMILWGSVGLVSVTLQEILTKRYGK